MKMLKDWFTEPGAYVLVDGQFGSTGKGLFAALAAEIGAGKITHVTTNAGPNSGHTSYWGDLKIVVKQIPTASVILNLMGFQVTTLLNAGAVINPDVLQEEIANFLDYKTVYIHPNAALINEMSIEQDKMTTKTIAGTGMGVGPAMATKLMRNDGDRSIASHTYMPMLPRGMRDDLGWDRFFNWETDTVFVEVSQGFSLGLNSANFYPNVTSRECTVMQAIADARIPAQMVKKVAMTLRTYPIRVGDTENTSGGCYPDQSETSWEEIGVPPELTTVTKRIRRVFTWSRIQFRDACAANRPDVLFLNFCNYLSKHQLVELLDDIVEDYISVMDTTPEIILGFGPKTSDICTLDEEMNQGG